MKKEIGTYLYMWQGISVKGRWSSFSFHQPQPDLEPIKLALKPIKRIYYTAASLLGAT